MGIARQVGLIITAAAIGGMTVLVEPERAIQAESPAVNDGVQRIEAVVHSAILNAQLHPYNPGGRLDQGYRPPTEVFHSRLRLSPDARIGGDNRIASPANEWPYSTVGIVSTESGGCTGTLVGPDIVLTNAHCLIGDGIAEVATNIRFYPGATRGNIPYGEHRAQRVYISPEYLNGQPQYDYGFVMLQSQPGNSVGWLGVQWFSPSWLELSDRWDMWGYPTNFVGAPFYFGLQTKNQEPCGGRDMVYGDAMFSHVCDSGQGSSGSPVIGWFAHPDGVLAPYVVGLNAAEWKGPRDERRMESCPEYQLGECGNLAVVTNHFLPVLVTLLSLRPAP